MRITAKNPIENSANVSLTGLPNGVSCSSGCGQVNDLNVDEGKNHLLTLRASDGAPAANGTQVTVRVVTARDATTKNFSLTVTAKQPEEKKPVSQVSGRVRDADTGDGIEGALVALADSENHRCVTTTGSSGSYKFTSCDGKPIAAGELFLGTSHEDYESITEKQINANPGQSVTVATFSLKSKKASATPSATPSAALTEEPAATDDQVSPAATEPATQNTAAEAGGGMGSWLLIVLGGLLVALGVGAIVLLVIRRKSDNGDDDDDDPEGGAPGPRSPVPGAQGVYHGAPDATRVANRAGAAPDATMVARPSLADAPTMLQSPVRDDEFPDPYGAPPMPARQPAQQQNDWAAPGGGYGAPTQVGAYGPGQQANGYGPEANGYGGPAQPAGAYGAAAPNGAPTAPGAYGRPTSGSGYGAPSGGPDGYGPTSGSGYGGAPNGPTAGDGYRPASPGGYGPQGGSAYGSPAAPGAPYGGAPPARPADDGYGGGYGAPQGGGYGPDPRGGDPRGADPRGGDRYDEPTGRWTGGAPGAGAGGYGAPQPPAGPAAAPYEDQRGYGGGAGYRPEPNSGGFQAAGGYGAPSDPYAGRPSAGNGYEDGGYGQGDAGYSGGGAGGYGAAPQSGGGYSAAPQAGGGYGADPRGGYGGDPRGGGYERVPEQRGYDQQQGGYDQGGYYGEQGGGHPQQPGGGRHGDPQQPATRAERRPLDWLDD
ncbi:carboxypeptidase regulatory-like domain-containing protein [Actinomycetes bacterium KLBMP 9797]